jgi:hypothetical protein
MKRFYAILNLVITVAVIAWNGLSNTGVIGGKTVGDVSDDLYNLFTPAGYAFSIWGLIFLTLLVNAIYQVRTAFKGDEIKQGLVLTGPWLTLANIGNGAWIWFWLNEYTGVSVIIMIIILLALLKTAFMLNIHRAPVSRELLVFGWWPISLYLGWISVALIANVAAYLSFNGWADTVNEELFTILMLIIATVVNLFVLYTRSMRTFCWVGVWALSAIAYRSEIDSILYTAISCAALLVILTIVHTVRHWREDSVFATN